MTDEAQPSEPSGSGGDKVMLIWVALVMAGVAFVMYSSIAPFTNGLRDRKYKPSCRGNLRQIAVMIGMYENDYGDQMPPDLTTMAVEGYLKIGMNNEIVEQNIPVGQTVLSCPERKDEPLMSSDLDGTSSYYYAQLKDPLKIAAPAEVPIMWEKKQTHREGIGTLFADLQARWEPLQALRARIERNADLYAKPPVLPEANKK